MQSRQTFMAAMGGVDPGEEGYDEYDEARRRPAQPPRLRSCVCAATHAHVRTVRPGARRLHGQAVKAVKHLRARLVGYTAPLDREVYTADGVEFYSRRRSRKFSVLACF